MHCGNWKILLDRDTFDARRRCVKDVYTRKEDVRIRYWAYRVKVKNMDVDGLLKPLID
jgi:hypothetical protein